MVSRPQHVLPLRRQVGTGSGPAAESRGDYREAHDGDDIVVSGDPVMSLEATAEAPMHEHLLAVGASEGADGLHARAAVTRPVPGHAAVDVEGVEAPGAMVAMAPAIPRLSDERAAVTATERFTSLIPTAWGAGRAGRCARAVPVGP